MNGRVKFKNYPYDNNRACEFKFYCCNYLQEAEQLSLRFETGLHFMFNKWPLTISYMVTALNNEGHYFSADSRMSFTFQKYVPSIKDLPEWYNFKCMLCGFSLIKKIEVELFIALMNLGGYTALHQYIAENYAFNKNV